MFPSPVSISPLAFLSFFFSLSLPDQIFTVVSLYPLSQHQDHHVLFPGAVHLLPRPGVRLVREPGRVLALERAQEASAAGRRLRLVGHGQLKPLLTLWVGTKPGAASRYLTLLARSFTSCVRFVLTTQHKRFYRDMKTQHQNGQVSCKLFIALTHLV